MHIRQFLKDLSRILEHDFGRRLRRLYTYKNVLCAEMDGLSVYFRVLVQGTTFHILVYDVTR